MRAVVAAVLLLALCASPCLAAWGAVGFPPPSPRDGAVRASGRALLGLCLAEPGRYLDGVERCLTAASGGEGSWRGYGLSLPDRDRAYLNALVVPGLSAWRPGEGRLTACSGLGWESVLTVRVLAGEWLDAGR